MRVIPSNLLHESWHKSLIKQAQSRLSELNINFIMAKAEMDIQKMLANGADPKELPWYEPKIDNIPEPAKTILENYSKIPPEQVLQHVMDVVSS